jgi:PAS domain-containing protein
MTTSLQSKNLERPGRYNGCPDKPMTELIPNGFFVVNQKWIVKHWNKAAEKLLAVKAVDIVGRNLWEVFAGIIPLQFYLFGLPQGIPSGYSGTFCRILGGDGILV